MDLSECQSVLDVGCGAGSITLELARHVPHVHGMDFSPGMLGCLHKVAQTTGQTNLSTQLKSWDDDWHDVPVCDVVLASRSTAVMDWPQRCRSCIAMHASACTLTSLVGANLPKPGCWVFWGGGTGRRFRLTTSYIIQILAQMGCQPELSWYIDCASPYSQASSSEAFLAGVESGLGPLGLDECQRLRIG